MTDDVISSEVVRAADIAEPVLEAWPQPPPRRIGRGTQRLVTGVPLPVHWGQLDPRIAALLPEHGVAERVAEHATLEGRIVTRGLELAVAVAEPLRAIEQLGAAVIAAGMRLVIGDHGIVATERDLTVHAGGEHLFELAFQLVAEHDDVDLRDEMQRCELLQPLLPLAEFGRFVTRVGSGRQVGRAPHAAMSIALDDDTRTCTLAWLAARAYRRAGSTWKLRAGGYEYVVAFERSEELGVNEATAFARPTR
ncbi:MAG: hypothetical protein KF773_14020 [Deltaproteobacteria bacterium]|nr:hypothetical protein [Deltaproteobacteria bacterium]